mmetsp:Transcript_29847/g.55047  ORF Transcript_29847/g.55047 Transcript_29847/m.55047 type:complete len:105 (-) Transcript_29847:127-441(-)
MNWYIMQDRHELNIAPNIKVIVRAIQNSIRGASNPNSFPPSSIWNNLKMKSGIEKIRHGARLSASRTSEKRRLSPTHFPKDSIRFADDIFWKNEEVEWLEIVKQ